jgi:hypothetical protein
MTTYQQWKYFYNSGKEPMFNIQPNEKYLIPPTLFKYYSLSEYNIDAVTHFYLYASHPNQLNDPTDCSKNLLDFSSCSENDLQAIYTIFFEKYHDIYGNIEELRKASPHYFTTILFRKIGIISLCREGNNPILWANYAKGNGFCVEFIHQNIFFPHCGPFPIHYVESLTPIIINNNVGDATLIQTNVKSLFWSQEHEFRILALNPEGLDFKTYEEGNIESEEFNIGDEHNRKLRYPVSAINSIILADGFLHDKDTRFYQVATNEFELVIINNPLKEKILRMLSCPKFTFKTKVTYLEPNGTIGLCTIKLYHLNEHTYRIIEL